VVPVFGPDAIGETAAHAYRVAGAYPVTLTLKAGSSAATDETTATIK
jgi:hypothetical protein